LFSSLPQILGTNGLVVVIVVVVLVQSLSVDHMSLMEDNRN